ncbi:MAG: ROK family protein [Deltaproteobacteria bacterium]
MSEERFAGFDVGGQAVKAVLVDRQGSLLATAEHPTGPDTNSDGLVEVLARLGQRLAVPLSSELMVGVGVAGVVGADGRLRGSPHLPLLLGQPLAALLAAGLGCRVLVENDANCAAVAEGWGGAADGIDDYLMVTLGSGLGSGLVLGGELRRSRSGHGCELGHSVVVEGGRVCACGSRGCLEAYFSETAARSMVAESAGELAGTIEELRRDQGWGHAQTLFALAARDNQEAGRIASRMLAVLARGLASAVNVLDLTTIIIGGGIAPVVMDRLDELRHSMEGALFARSADEVALLGASRGPWAGAIGAARLAMLAR